MADSASGMALRKRKSVPLRFGEETYLSLAQVAGSTKPLKWHKGEKSALHTYLQQQVTKVEEDPTSLGEDPIDYKELQRRIPTRSQQEIKDFLGEVVGEKERKVKDRHRLITAGSCLGAKTVNEWYEKCSKYTEKLAPEKETKLHIKAATEALGQLFSEDLLDSAAASVDDKDSENQTDTEDQPFNFNRVVEYFKDCMEGKNNIADNPLSGFDALVALELLKDIEHEKPPQDSYIHHLAEMYSWYRDQDLKETSSSQSSTKLQVNDTFTVTNNPYLNPMGLDASAVTFQP